MSDAGHKARSIGAPRSDAVTAVSNPSRTVTVRDNFDYIIIGAGKETIRRTQDLRNAEGLVPIGDDIQIQY